MLLITTSMYTGTTQQTYRTSAGSDCYILPSDAPLSPLLSRSLSLKLPSAGSWGMVAPNPIFSVLSKRLKNCFSHKLLCPDSFSMFVSTVFLFLSALGFSWEISFLTLLP